MNVFYRLTEFCLATLQPFTKSVKLGLRQWHTPDEHNALNEDPLINRSCGRAMAGRRVRRGFLMTARNSAPLSQPNFPIAPSAPDPLPNARAGLIAGTRPDSVSDEAQSCALCGVRALSLCPVCEHEFCHSHIYRCSSCNAALCGLCLDAHRLDGHWDDSDTICERYGAQSPERLIQNNCIT